MRAPIKSSPLLLLAWMVVTAALPLWAETPATQSGLPADARPLAEEAADALKQNHYAIAEAKYQAILKQHPDCLYAWSNLGVVYFQDRQLQKALSAFQKAAALNPQDALTSFHLGMTFYELNALTEAEQNLKTYAARCPTAPEPHGMLALIYKKQNRPVEASREQSLYEELKKTTPVQAPDSGVRAI